MAFGDELRKKTKNEAQLRAEHENRLLLEREKTTTAFKALCLQAANKGMTTATFNTEGESYASHARCLGTYRPEDLTVLKQICSGIEADLSKENFIKLRVSINPIHKMTTIYKEPVIFYGIILRKNRSKQKKGKIDSYSIIIEASW